MRKAAFGVVKPDKTQTCLLNCRSLQDSWNFGPSNNIGIEHGFLCINICWALREVLKPEPRGPADVNVSEKHVWSLLLHKNILSLENLGEIVSKSSFFRVPIMAQKSMLPANVLKMPLPGQRLMSSWRHKITFSTVCVTDDDVSFCDGLGMLICKTAKPYINSTKISLLIHGFVPVKTWLLIACDAAFYAIIGIIQPR